MRREYVGRDITKLLERLAAERSSWCERGQVLNEEIDETFEFLGANMKEKVSSFKLDCGGGGVIKISDAFVFEKDIPDIDCMVGLTMFFKFHCCLITFLR
jgi:hypothetical protein